MNYQRLKLFIIAVTLIALAISALAFWWGYELLPLASRDLSGASGAASVLPAFAGVLIAAVALYSYVKIEDSTLENARSLAHDRRELLAHLRALGYQILHGGLVIQNKYLEKYTENMISKLDIGPVTINNVIIKKPSIEGEQLPDEHLLLIKKWAYSNSKQKMTDYNKSILNIVGPEISRLLVKLTPLVLANNNFDTPNSINAKSLNDELWLNSMSSIFKSMYILSNDNDDLDSLVNFANGIDHSIALLSNERLKTEDSIYRVLISSTGKMDTLDAKIAEMREVLYSEAGERPQIKPVF